MRIVCIVWRRGNLRLISSVDIWHRMRKYWHGFNVVKSLQQPQSLLHWNVRKRRLEPLMINCIPECSWLLKDLSILSSHLEKGNNYQSYISHLKPMMFGMKSLYQGDCFWKWQTTTEVLAKLVYVISNRKSITQIIRME